MLRKRLPFVLVLSVVAVLPQAQASNIKRQPQRFAPVNLPYIWNTDVALNNGAFVAPSSPDNWLGGTGNWSNGADWSAGLPGGSSDVTINTGNDTVTLDTSASINSLTLGGSSGSSQLTGDGNTHTLTIAGALTVNQSGNLYLNADGVGTGADFTNQGTASIEYASVVQVAGNVNNSGTLNMGQSNRSSGNTLNVTGTLTNAGTINVGFYEIQSGGSGIITVGALNNSGTINLTDGLGPTTTLQVNGDAMNSGLIYFGVSNSLAVNGNFTNAGTIQTNSNSGDGCFCQISVAGTVTNTSTGSFTVDGNFGVLQAGSLVNQGSLAIEDQAKLLVTGDASNSGTVTLSGGPEEPEEQFIVGGTLTNSAGAQILVMNDSSIITATNVVNGGTISLEAGNTTKLIVSGNIQNSGTISAINFAMIQAENLSNSGTVEVTNGTTLQVAGPVNNSGTILTGNFVSGNTISIGGKLTNSMGANFNLNYPGDVASIGYVTNAGLVSLASSTTLNVTGGARAAVTALPGFLNSGFVDIYPGSTLSDALTYTQTTGQTTVDGTLHVSARGVLNFAGGEVYGNQGTIQGSITNNAAINIGDGPQLVGAMTFMGNYTQGPNGSLTFDIAGPATGQYDQLNISRHAQFNGLMTVDLLHGYIPQIGNNFDIMNFASESGTFSMVVGLPINNQEHFTLEYNSTNLTLDVVSGPSQGTRGGNVGSEPFITSAEQDSAPYSLTAANQLAPDPAPEPGSIFLFGTGVTVLAGLLRSRR